MALGFKQQPRTEWLPDGFMASPGVYLTDERDLFRVISNRVVDGEPYLEIEDCFTLEKLSVPVSVAVALRAVRPTVSA